MKFRSMSLHSRRAFTLIELLASTAILVMIMGVVAFMANQTSRTWLFTVSKVQQFSAARTAFDTITSRLEQATLNTYWNYVNANGTVWSASSNTAGTFAPTAYARQSELRFLTLTGTSSVSTSNNLLTHAIFFQAPLGYSQNTASAGELLAGLDKLMNACGFYVQFNSDKNFFPSFLSTVPAVTPRYRFRLMEYKEPADQLSLYSYTSGNPTYDSTAWFADAFGTLGTAPVHILAENVIALVLLPKLSQEEDSTGISLAPNYAYDSANTTDSTSQNQLPPEVQVTMVALDETSAQRLAGTNGTSMPANLLTGAPFTNATNYSADLQTLVQTLNQLKLNYRVFTTTVTIRAANWENIQP